MQEKFIEPYGEIRAVAPKLWCLDGEWRKTTFRRRMTILADSNGDLLIHNPFSLKESDYKKVAALGNVRWIVAPNRFHCSEVVEFALRFPAAEIHSSPLAVKSLKGCELKILPNSWKHEDIRAVEISGTRGLGEIVFYHPWSKTLIVTDLVFNELKGKNTIEQAFFRANGIVGFSVSRIFRFIFTKNEKELLNSIAGLLKFDFDRLIPNHGSILETGAKEKLRQGFSIRFPKYKYLLA
jgi:hypothetical protein